MSEEEKKYNSLLHSGMFWKFHPELTGVWKQDKYQKYGLDGQYITFPPNISEKLNDFDLISFEGKFSLHKLIYIEGKYKIYTNDRTIFISLKMLLKPWVKL